MRSLCLDQVVTGLAVCAFLYTHTYAIDIFSVWCTKLGDYRSCVSRARRRRVSPFLILPCVPQLYSRAASRNSHQCSTYLFRNKLFPSSVSLVLSLYRDENMMLHSSSFVDPILIYKVIVMKKKIVSLTQRWCWINGRVTWYLPRPLIQRARLRNCVH